MGDRQRDDSQPDQKDDRDQYQADNRKDAVDRVMGQAGDTDQREGAPSDDEPAARDDAALASEHPVDQNPLPSLRRCSPIAAARCMSISG